MAKTQRYLLWINAVLGGVLALAPFVLFPVCADPKPDGTPMGCYYSGIFITIMGVLVIVFSLLSAQQKKWGALSFIASGTAAALCWLVPNKIVPVGGADWACGICGKADHACRVTTMPAVGVLVAVIVVASVAGLIMNFVKGKN